MSLIVSAAATGTRRAAVVDALLLVRHLTAFTFDFRQRSSNKFAIHLTFVPPTVMGEIYVLTRRAQQTCTPGLARNQNNSRRLSAAILRREA